MTAETQTKPLPIQEALTDNPEFHTGLQELAGRLPEVAERQEAIQQRGDELIYEFGISPELFADGSHVLLFSAIADRYATLENDRGDMSTDVYTGEKEFIGDALMLLALDKSAYFDEVKGLVGMGEEDDATDRKSLYDRFTNRQVTQELTTVIKAGGLLDDVKGRLGVTSENEDDFTIRVLNIGRGNVLDDMRPRPPKELDRMSLADHSYAAAGFRDYAKDLRKNRDEFLASGNGNGMFDIGDAWVEHADDGKQTLVVLLPTAEQILYPNEMRGLPSAHEKERERLMHEYTHTQGGINIGQFFGVSGEEFRANYFPRRKDSYGDVDQFSLDIKALTGFDMRAHLDSHVKGGTAEDYFFALAENAGLQGALEVAIMPPTSVISDDRPIQKQIATHLGGFDAIGRRMYLRASQDPIKAADVDARLNDWAESWAQAPEHVVRNKFLKRKNYYGLDFVSDEVEKRVMLIQSQAGREQKVPAGSK